MLFVNVLHQIMSSKIIVTAVIFMNSVARRGRNNISFTGEVPFSSRLIYASWCCSFVCCALPIFVSVNIIVNFAMIVCPFGLKGVL